MTTVVRGAVASLTHEQRLQIIDEHRRLERDGCIGDCLLRTVAAQIADTFGGHGGMAPVWMDQVANAVYRFYADAYIRSLDDGC